MWHLKDPRSTFTLTWMSRIFNRHEVSFRNPFHNGNRKHWSSKKLASKFVYSDVHYGFVRLCPCVGGFKNNYTRGPPNSLHATKSTVLTWSLSEASSLVTRSFTIVNLCPNTVKLCDEWCLVCDMPFHAIWTSNQQWSLTLMQIT